MENNRRLKFTRSQQMNKIIIYIYTQKLNYNKPYIEDIFILSIIQRKKLFIMIQNYNYNSADYFLNECHYLNNFNIRIIIINSLLFFYGNIYIIDSLTRG